MSAPHCPICSQDWCQCSSITFYKDKAARLEREVRRLKSENARLSRRVDWYARLLVGHR